MSKLGVGDRVVVVNVDDSAKSLIGERGVVIGDHSSKGYEYFIEVRLGGLGEAPLFKPEELEFEHIYDAMSTPSDEDVVLAHELAEALFSGDKVDSRDDVINSPSHYAEGWSNGAEVIDLTEHLNFNRGNAVKYLARAGKKGGPEKELEDLQKALWYVRREVLRLGGTV